MARKERYLVGLDVGTSKVTAVVAEMLDGAGLDIVGLGVAESRGIRRGVVVNLEAAVDSIKKAIDEAELMAGVEIDTAHLALTGPHIKGFNSRGVIAVAGKNREITREDVRRAIDAAKAVSLPTGREILHVLPQDFVVDEQDGIGAPVGMTGARLEVNVHIVTGSQSSTQNIVACVNRAGVTVAETVAEQIAASESVLTEDEKELGVALVDIGGGTTDIAIYERGSLWHTAVVGVGGDHFTNDIAVGLRTPVPDAEKIKRKCGCALSGMVDEDETMEVASVGGRNRHRADRRRRHPRRHAGNRRADFRPADPPRLPRRRRRPRRSREQPIVRDRRRPGPLRIPQFDGRAGARAGRRRRVRACRRQAAWTVQRILLTAAHWAPGLTAGAVNEETIHGRLHGWRCDA